MAKKGTPSNTTVKILRAIYRKAKMVAAHTDRDLSEYLSSLLEKPVDRDYRKMLSELGDQAEAEADQD